MEIFKQILGSENYFISNFGRVKTINWRNTKREAVLKPATDKKGYLRVALSIGGKLITYKVHRLVAIYFLENPENKPQVNHIDGIKSNNVLSNLEWSTNSENQLHAVKLGLVKSKKGTTRNAPWTVGEKNYNSVLTNQIVSEIRSKFKKRIYTRKMLSIEYGVKESTIKDVVLRKSWSHV